MKKINQAGFTLVEGLLVIIALALVTGVGYYVYSNQADKNSSKTTAVGNGRDSGQKTAKTDPYAGWQTYTNAEAGFTLRYPSDWMFNSKGSKTKSGDGEFGGDQFISKANYDADNNASILQLQTDVSELSAESYAKQQYDAAAIATAKSFTSSKINGYDAQTVNFSASGDGNNNGYDVFVSNKGHIVELTYYPGTKDTETFKAIINSIKF